MKNAAARLLLLVTLCVGSTAVASPAKTEVQTGTGIGEHIPPFTARAMNLSGVKPQPSDFDSQKTSRITAYVFVGTTCPATNAYTDRFRQIEQAYGGKGVDFLYIYPNSNDTSETKLAFHKQQKLTGRLIDDQGATLARLFKAQRTSELFVADKQGIVVYHGAVDDSRDPNAVKQRYLATALDELLAGKPITTASSQVFA